MKFYVVSGEIRAVICASHINNAEDAACEAMLQFLQEGINCAPLVIVSERGFDFNAHEQGEDLVFATNDILIKSGFIFEDDDNEH